MGLIIGSEYEFFKHEDQEGKTYLCIECPGITEEEFKRAQEVIEKYKAKISKGK